MEPINLSLRRWSLASWFLLLLLGLGAGSAWADSASSKEPQIKAAFLFNFIKFVEWPARTLSNSTQVITVGFLGKSAVGAELQANAKDSRLNGHPIKIKHLVSIEDACAVDVLFLSAAEDENVLPWLAKLQGTPVLTVGESLRFAEAGGMITFFREADKVRFQINATAAARAGLTINAQLLRLAKPMPGGRAAQ